jgi:5-methylcytosine-specific restriction endonuclease McrA
MDITKRPTLVLNRNWQPVMTCTVRDAITALFGGDIDKNGKPIPKAQVLDVVYNEDGTYDCIPYYWDKWAELPVGPDEPAVHAGGEKKFRVPKIIIYASYNRIPKNQLNFNRPNVFKRDQYTCQYCGKPGNSIDHVHPQSKGGKNNWENCVACCWDCNQKKKNHTLEESGMKLLKQPTKPGLEILGFTKVRMKEWDIFFNK